MNRVDRISRHPVITGVYDSSYVVRAAVRLFVRRKQTGWLADYLSIYVTKGCRGPGVTGHEYSVARSIRILRRLKNFLEEKGVDLLLLRYDSSSDFSCP